MSSNKTNLDYVILVVTASVNFHSQTFPYCAISQRTPFVLSISLTAFFYCYTAKVYQAFSSLTVTELRVVSSHVFYLSIGILNKYINRSELWLFLQIAAGSVGPTLSMIFFGLLTELCHVLSTSRQVILFTYLASAALPPCHKELICQI